MVTIQDYHQKDGKQFPKTGGTSLTAEQWVSIKNNIPAIEEAITRMKSRLRLPTTGKPSEPAVSCFVVDSAQTNATVNNKRMEASIYNSNSIADLQESNFEGSKQMEVNSNASTPNPLHHTPPNIVHHPTISLPPPGLMYMPVRLDGTNYYLWKHQMEFSLAELKVVYVLTEACPNFSSTSSGTPEEIDETKALIQKWVDDDYICRHNILTCLGDNLYNDYSRKACSAKELWEELKSVYDEDIGTKRSQINKYVQFQIVDGVSILEQVHELQSIAHSICASGIWIEEYFHVSFIISKLPPSWKEFRLRMMREEFLPLHMLMHRLKVEEDARSGKQPGKPSGHGAGSKCESRVGSQGKEMKKLCYNCKKSGHISKHCPDRKKEFPDNGPTKENGHRLKGDHRYQG
ncbi:hypothetical protein Leryth_025636 [Lithospermum erythrorhizon]|nr:hypothetical protein Leryth_025636 [Lithospermum erythrorhizon]